MDDNTNSTSFDSKFIAHVVIEACVVGGMALFFYNKSNTLSSRIDRLEEEIGQLYSILNAFRSKMIQQHRPSEISSPSETSSPSEIAQLRGQRTGQPMNQPINQRQPISQLQSQPQLSQPINQSQPKRTRPVNQRTPIRTESETSFSESDLDEELANIL